MASAKTQRGGFGFVGGWWACWAVWCWRWGGGLRHQGAGAVRRQGAGPHRGAGCRQAEKNRQWDPNAPLHGCPRPPCRAAAAAPAGPGARPDRRDRRAPEPPARGRQRPPPNPPASKPPRTSSEAGALGTGPGRWRDVSQDRGLIRSPTSVQVGAYGSADEAEQQRARLAMNGSGPHHRARAERPRDAPCPPGPYDSREDAERMRDQLSARARGDAALVRVLR